MLWLQKGRKSLPSKLPKEKTTLDVEQSNDDIRDDGIQKTLEEFEKQFGRDQMIKGLSLRRQPNAVRRQKVRRDLKNRFNSFKNSFLIFTKFLVLPLNLPGPSLYNSKTLLLNCLIKSKSFSFKPGQFVKLR